MLRQVFVDLLGNAIKYTSRRPRATIEIGCRQSDIDEVEVFVRDNGVGFDMQYAHKLFGVFSGYIARRSSRAPESDWPM